MGCWVLEGEKGEIRSRKRKGGGIAAILGLIWGHLEAILGWEVGIWVQEGEKRDD